MPRHSTQQYHNREFPELGFKYVVNVDTEGFFTTTIPEDIVRVIEDHVRLDVNRAKRKGYFSSKTLDGCVCLRYFWQS